MNSSFPKSLSWMPKNTTLVSLPQNLQEYIPYSNSAQTMKWQSESFYKMSSNSLLVFSNYGFLSLKCPAYFLHESHSPFQVEFESHLLFEAFLSIYPKSKSSLLFLDFWNILSPSGIYQCNYIQIFHYCCLSLCPISLITLRSLDVREVPYASSHPHDCQGSTTLLTSLFIHLADFIEYLICVRNYSQFWDITTNKADGKILRLSSKGTQITNVSENMEEREPLCTVGGNVNWCSHYGKQYGMGLSQKKLKIGIPVMAKWKRIWIGTMRLQVRSLASLSQLKSRCGHELWCKSQTRLRSCIAVAVAMM